MSLFHLLKYTTNITLNYMILKTFCIYACDRNLLDDSLTSKLMNKRAGK